MKSVEIGSEFDAVLQQEKVNVRTIFGYLSVFDTIYFDSGRSALRHLLLCIPGKRVLLPGYICESVRACFKDYNVNYYNIDRKFKIDWDSIIKQLPHTDILYLHYFNGYIGSDYPFSLLEKLKKKYGFVIIEDTTHSIFSEASTVGDYCICSLRKWFPIPDGGVLYSKIPLIHQKYVSNCWYSFKYKAMEWKHQYLEGKKIIKDTFLSEFRNCEKKLDLQTQPYAISEISSNILQLCDIDAIVIARRENCKYLCSRIKQLYEVVSIGGRNQVPLFLTLSVENRDEVRSKLVNNGIYPPVHWPLFEDISAFPNSLYNNRHELSIPIDQRYGLREMDFIAETLETIAEGLDYDRID